MISLHDNEWKCDPSSYVNVYSLAAGIVIFKSLYVHPTQFTVNWLYNVQLFMCKEQLNKEAAMKDDALKEKKITQQLLHLKSKVYSY